MNSWLRYFFLFIVVVFLQVTIGNSIHLLGVAIPFLYIYFIIRLPLSLSVNWTLTLAFILGLVIDIFSNTPGMNALACTVVAFLRKPILNLYTPRGEDYSESEPSIRNFGMSLFVRYVLTFSLCFCTLLFVIANSCLLLSIQNMKLLPIANHKQPMPLDWPTRDKYCAGKGFVQTTTRNLSLHK